jgi:hypothetical protein
MEFGTQAPMPRVNGGPGHPRRRSFKHRIGHSGGHGVTPTKAAGVVTSLTKGRTNIATEGYSDQLWAPRKPSIEDFPESPNTP